MDAATIIERAERVLRDRIYSAAVVGWHRLDLSMWAVDGEPVAFERARWADFAPAGSGTAWGTPWSTAWFRATGTVPQDWGPDEVDLDIDLGWTWGPATGEALMYTPDGSAIESLGPGRPRIPWRTHDIDVFIEAAANPMPTFDWRPTDSSLGPAPDSAPRMFVSRAQVVRVNRDAQSAAEDMITALGLARDLTEPARKAEVLKAISAACDVVDDLGMPDEHRWLAFNEAMGAVFASPAPPDAPVLTALANAHIDTAWLWPFRETERKVARTFSNALALMDEDPDVVFASSQVQHLAWIAQGHPDLFQRIKARVDEGRWIVVGGTWVEPDGNMPSGESFARQFLQGQTWLADNLGLTVDVFWLPDTFGYSAGLPQIARAAGCDTFVTQKLSWNSVNVFPYTTLLWEGLDGSRLLTHFPPADNYSCAVLPMELTKARTKMSKQPVTNGLFLYGFGDGGGGPTREMADRIDQLSDVSGLPRLRHGSVAEFFQAVREELPEPPVWSGELYLEYHRGTLTSQAQIKQAHRRAEVLLREAEMWATGAQLQRGHAYPSEQLRDAWRELLVMQFHDVLPGTSIGWVHDEAVERLQAVVTMAQQTIDGSLAALAASGSQLLHVTASPHGHPGVPALGSAPAFETSGSRTATESQGLIELANARFRALVADGVVTSLIDLTVDRELVAPGKALGRYRMHPDRPTRWDAWDLDEQHMRGTVVVAPSSWELVSDATVVVEREWRGTTIRTHLILREDGLEIASDVDWHAEDCLLRLECDVDVLAGLTTAETMYGFVQRQTVTNTGWEQAKFETSAHRWLHIGEPGYAVAVLTPTTYGHQVTRKDRDGGGVFTRIGFSLLRSAAFPDPRRDAGRHQFRHIVLPGLGIPDVVAAADRDSFPVRHISGSTFPPVASVESTTVAVEAVKLAEDGSGDVVVRLRETCGTAAKARVRLCVPSPSVVQTDLIERGTTDVDPQALRFRPFEVKTLRFRR